MRKNIIQQVATSLYMEIQHLTLEVGGLLLCGLFPRGNNLNRLGRLIRKEGHPILEEYGSRMCWPPMSWEQFLFNGELLNQSSTQFYLLGLRARR